jgi:hypothetical protein
MQLPLPFDRRARPSRNLPATTLIVIGRLPHRVTFVRHARARHYVLHVDDDASLRVTVPRGGSRAEALKFVRQQSGWVERERCRVALESGLDGPWRAGTRLLLRGEEVTLEVDEARAAVRVGAEWVPTGPRASASARDLREAVSGHLRRLAVTELPARLTELAGAHGYAVSHVSVRNQRSQWGSCSPGGRISLDWRLIQVPPPVRDYVLLHELTHLEAADHSRRFWKALEAACPWHRDARAWLRTARLIRPAARSGS